MMDERTVGVLGGGQLGRMMAEAGHRLGIRLVVLDPLGSSSPAGQVCQLSIDGSFRDPTKIKELASISDLITVEIEHVDVEELEALVLEGHTVRPSPACIRVIQDKYAQKVYLRDNSSTALGPFMAISSRQDALQAGDAFGYPYMLKNRHMAYDGKGNYLVNSQNDVDVGFAALGGLHLYAEKFVNYSKELAVMVVSSACGVAAYPVVETHQRDSICSTVVCPAQISPYVSARARDIAINAVRALPGNENYGVFGVELFLDTDDDSVLLNEIAPRPHNSGHYTMEACGMDQFEAHIRAVLGMAVNEAALSLKVGCACMVNVLGVDTHMPTSTALLRRAMGVPQCGVHWYGKAYSRKGRKLAHFTITADTWEELHVRVDSVCGLDSNNGSSSTSKEQIPSAHMMLTQNIIPVRGIGSAPEVAVIMGSDSDLPCMTDAITVLEKFGIPHEVTIVSAHRTPTRMYAFAQSAVDRGLKVIIAGAGGAAHLPGMVAALTPLPVVGVPVKSSALSGNDSLLSIVQMPRGVPVATVAIGNSTNAGLLAVKIIATGRPALITKLEAFMVDQEDQVLAKAARLEAVGYKEY